MEVGLNGGYQDPLRVSFGGFELDEAEARLTRNGRAVPLAPKTFALLCVLARQPGALISKNALLDAVWGHRFVSDSALKTTISELRAALADDARHPRYIETAARRGYRFIAGASQCAEASVAANCLPVQAVGLVGREEGLARLRESWRSACRGTRQIVWIAGEAGVGKTTLIDHFVSSLDTGARGFGQCVQQYGAGEPYLPVLDALADLCRQDSSVAPLMRSIAPTWLLQLPWLSSEDERRSLLRELAGASQDRMLREWGELIDRLTAERPLLLVTEDLHWSDHATVHLMNHVARRRTPARFLWLASFRLTEIIAHVHPLNALRHELRLHRLCREILLDPFSEQETAEFIVRRHPGFTAPESVVRALHARTEGLPLFLSHVLDDLFARSGFHVVDDEAGVTQQVAALAVPESLAGIIAKHFERLSGDEQDILEAASIVGAEFRASTVAEALGQDSGRIVAHCEALVRQRQWLDAVAVEALADDDMEARYRFRHALYRQVIYQRTGPLSRARLHRRVAVSLQTLRARGAAVTAAELATHFELGHDAASALRYATEATESALRHFAPQEAMDLSARALERVAAVPAGGARDAMALTLTALGAAAAAQCLGVSAREARDGFERALALLERQQDHPQRALVLHGLGLVLMVRGEYPAASALAARTHELAVRLDDRALLLSACSVLGQIKTLQGHHREACLWLERGVAACESLGDERLQATFFVDPGVTMYAALAVPLVSLGQVDQARARCKAAQARAQALGEPMAQMVAAWFASILHVRLGDVDAVEAIGNDMHRVVDAAALAQGRLASRWIRGWAMAYLGAPLDGYRQIRAAYEENVDLGMLSGASEVLGYATEALLLADAPQAAREQLDQAFGRVSERDECIYLPQLHILQARLALAEGRPEAARSALRDGMCEARRQNAPWLELTVALAAWTLVGGGAAELAELAQICARVPEGHDTGPMRAARALLDRNQPG